MRYLIKNLDGSERQLEVDGPAVRAVTRPAPFSEMQPRVGQFFVFGDGLYARTARHESGPNVLLIGYSGGYVSGHEGRPLDYCYDRTSGYVPINIWTGKPL